MTEEDSKPQGRLIFHCAICKKGFKKLSQVNRHMVSHSDERPFQCQFCSKSFKLNHARTRHQQQVHTHELPFTCGICRKGFLSMYPLEVHLLTHVTSKENGATSSQGHMDTVNATETITSSLIKQEPEIPMKSYEDVKLDKSLYSNATPSRNSISLSSGISKREISEEDFNSDGCFVSENDFNVESYHQTVPSSPKIQNQDIVEIKQEDYIIISDDELTASSDNQTQDRDTNTLVNEYLSDVDGIFVSTDNSVTCAVKDESTSGEATDGTVVSDTQTPKYCPICNKEYRYSSHFERHVLSHRISKNDANVCQLCGQSFTQKSSLTRHMILHSDNDPFVCEFCNKGFKFSYSLQIHRRIHTGHKPYKCEVCNKAFSNKPNLDSHFRIHTGEKPYECDTCGKLFRQLNGLQHHQKTHKELNSCYICNLVLKSKQMLKKHMNIHKRERNFMCKVCEKYFLDKRSLNRHIKVTSCSLGRVNDSLSEKYSNELVLNSYTELN